MKNKMLRIVSSVMAAVMFTGGLIMNVNAESKTEKTGSYVNTKYELSGLKNPDGTLVEGINYTPLWNYGWFTGAVEDARYKPEKVREDLAIVKQLGYNSIRLMSPFGWCFNKKEKSLELLDNYDDVLLACRENGLTVTMCLQGYKDEDYTAEGSFTRWLLNEWLTRFDKKYADVIVMYEASNEPDLNIFTHNVEDGKNQYATNTEWLNVKRPLLQFIRDWLKDEFKTEKPVSIGAMTTSLYTSWDAENFDVCNLHPYIDTIENTDTYVTNVAAKMDTDTLGYVRPMVFSEISWVSGNKARTSDIVQYCRENGIAYYVWGFAALSNEQHFQGIMDTSLQLRTSSLAFDTISNWNKHFSLSVAGFDDTPSGGGALIAGEVNSALTMSGLTNVDKNAKITALYKAAQSANSQLGALAPYLTADFRESFLLADGDDITEKLTNSLANSVLSILPYIRTYGTYSNDNKLGGTLDANYYCNMQKWNTSRNQSYWRARYTLTGGKDGSKGIYISGDDMLMVGQKFDTSKQITLSVDVKPTVDAWIAIGVACGDDSDTSYEANNPGVYFRVSHEESKDSSENESSIAQAANTIQVYTINADKKEQWRKSIKLDEKLFNDDGYINITITYSGNGTVSDPFSAKVYSGDELLGVVTDINNLHFAEGAKQISLSNHSYLASFIDNLVISDESGVLLSDAFENGKYDNDYVVYYPETEYNGFTNVSYYNSLYRSVIQLLGKKISYKVPENFSAYVCDNYLAVEWDYSGIGESGFEIQKSADGKNWEAIWRTQAGTRSAIIPLYGEDGQAYSYRISPITVENKTTKFTESVKAAKGEGEKDGYFASYTTSDGRKETFEVIGNGVYRSSDVNEVANEDTGLWIEKYVKKTDSKADIKNVAYTDIMGDAGDIGGDGDVTTDPENPSTGDLSVKTSKTEKLILGIAGGVILLALAGIAIFGVKLKKKA